MDEIQQNGIDSLEKKLSEERKKISKLSEKSLKKGDAWCLIDTKWFKQWEKYITNDGYPWETELDYESMYPGPIDNSPLFAPGVDVKFEELREHLAEGIDYEILPEEAWTLLVEWYGIVEGQCPIMRKVVERGEYFKKTTVEIYPILLKLCKYKKEDTQITKKYSITMTVDELEQDMKQSLSIPKDQETRIWNAYLPGSYEDMSVKTKTLEEYTLQKGQMVVIEEKNEDGTWPHNGTWPSDAGKSSTLSNGITSPYLRSTSSNFSNSFSPTSNFAFSSTSKSPITLSTRKLTPGLCGLSNLGNTCFMNSAIQCLSNVPALTDYFKNNNYKKDLNYTNPLGMKGKVASEYAEIIKVLWSGEHFSFSPKDFKVVLGQFEPRFIGYQQQDSQELLAFLIDGLHEDLNRISNKPYVESKDANGRPDEVVANEAWGNHLKRNDSHIVETLHGLFRSTVVCPDCSKVSVTFDPFCFLSLPLPVKRQRSIECTFVPMKSDESLTKYKVTVPKDGTIKHLCKGMSEYNSLPYHNMTAAELNYSRFQKVYASIDSLRNIYEKDEIYIFESPDDATMVPVYTRTTTSTDDDWNLVGQPVLIPVSLNNTTYRDLYKAILKGVFRYLRNADLKKEIEDFLNRENSEDVDLEEDKSEESGEQEENKERDLYSLFQIKTINSFGTQEYRTLQDTKEPLAFTVHTYFSADWNKEAYNDCFTDRWLSVMDLHVSAEFKEEEKDEESVINLRSCMELFTSKERLEEDNTWYCSKCEKHQQAYKKLDLWMLPPILIIHLKRFTNTRWSRDKIDTFVDFPTRDLDLTDFVVNPAAKSLEKERRCYNLVAVSNHYGVLGGGHYTAYAKNFNDKEWHYFEDSCVTDSSEDQVVTKAAYILVYQRQDVETWSNQHPDKPFPFFEPLFSPRAMGLNSDSDKNPFEFKQDGIEENEDLLNNNNADDAMDTT